MCKVHVVVNRSSTFWKLFTQVHICVELVVRLTQIIYKFTCVNSPLLAGIKGVWVNLTNPLFNQNVETGLQVNNSSVVVNWDDDYWISINKWNKEKEMKKLVCMCKYSSVGSNSKPTKSSPLEARQKIVIAFLGVFNIAHVEPN